jgi:hypothetical protein
MPSPLNQIRLLAFIARFCVAWFNAAVGMPVEALSSVKKTVLLLCGDRLSIPAGKTTEQVLMAGLSRGQPEDLGIFSDYLDLARLPAAQHGHDLVRHLRAMYAARKTRRSDRGREFRACTPRQALCGRADCLCEFAPL